MTMHKALGYDHLITVLEFVHLSNLFMSVLGHA